MLVIFELKKIRSNHYKRPKPCVRVIDSVSFSSIYVFEVTKSGAIGTWSIFTIHLAYSRTEPFVFSYIYNMQKKNKNKKHFFVC